MDAQKDSASCITEQTSLTSVEKSLSLFQSDTLLSAQLFDDRRGKTLLEPEKKLMLAVLEDAINCFQDNHRARCGKSKQIFDEAQEWIFCVSDWVFGFENICSILSFDPEYIRAGLMRWREKQLSGHSGAVL